MICQYCGGKVVKAPAKIIGRNEDRSVLVCEGYYLSEYGETIPDNLLHDHSIKRFCSSYVLCHRPDSKYGNADEPMGILANETLRKKRNSVTRKFMRLYNEGIIHEIWPSFVLEYKTREGDGVFALRVKEETIDGKEYVTIKILDGSVMRVAKSMTCTVSSRTKAYLWLSRQMGVDFDGLALQGLNEEELEKVNDIITLKTER